MKKTKLPPPRLDEAGRSAFWYAAMEGKTEKVKQFLTAGENPNIGDYERMTPLYIAALRGHVETVRLLLENGADPNLVDCNDTSMLQLVTHEAGLVRGTPEHLEVVKLLLDKGADPDHPNKWGATPRKFAEIADGELLYIYKRLKKRTGKKPGPGRRAPTPREAAGTKDESYYWTIHARLWDELVPASGQAKTVQGEVVRIVGKLTREAYANGNINWTPTMTKLWRFVGDTLDDEATFSKVERKQIAEWIKTIIRDRKRPDVSGEGSPYYLVAESAVRWVVANPKAKKLKPDPTISL